MDKRRQTKSSFSDLSHELLSNISDQLRLIDLLSFRGVCRNTRYASSNSSGAIEEQCSSQFYPWFLLYGDGPNCSIVTNTNNKRRRYKNNKRYNINLPEIANSNCVASFAGWLLFLSSDKSMFFFCPFSRAKINLPNCPHPWHPWKFTAAFSHPPTHRDCVVVILWHENFRSRNNNNSNEIWLLRRGDSEWCKYEHDGSFPKFGLVKSVMYHEGTFSFLHDYQGVVNFDVEKKTWSMSFTVPVRNRDYHVEDYKVRNKKIKEMKSILGIQKGACTIRICGTSVLKGTEYRLIKNYVYSDGNFRTERQLKGVWIESRFHQIPPNQSWSL